MKELIAKMKELVSLYEQEVRVAGEPKVPDWLKEHFDAEEQKALGGLARNKKHWREYKQEHPDTDKATMVDGIFNRLEQFYNTYRSQLRTLIKSKDTSKLTRMEKENIKDLRHKVKVLSNMLSKDDEKVEPKKPEKVAVELERPHYVDPRLVRTEDNKNKMLGEKELDAEKVTDKMDFDMFHAKKASRELQLKVAEELAILANDIMKDED